MKDGSQIGMIPMRSNGILGSKLVLPGSGFRIRSAVIGARIRIAVRTYAISMGI